MPHDQVRLFEGRVTIATVPGFALENASAPPYFSTTLLATARPSPMPFPGGLVVKNGSVTLFRSSAGIPAPSSRTQTTVDPSGFLLVDTQMFPRSWTASQAFSIRLTNTWLRL